MSHSLSPHRARSLKSEPTSMSRSI
jgi:hypothetical protein